MTYCLTDKAEVDALEMYCRNLTHEEAVILLQCAQRADSKIDISSELFMSLSMGISYDRLFKVIYIPVKRNMFYKYRNDTLAAFREYLVNNNRWN